MYINDIVEEAAETEEVKVREIQRVEYEIKKFFSIWSYIFKIWDTNLDYQDLSCSTGTRTTH